MKFRVISVLMLIFIVSSDCSRGRIPQTQLQICINDEREISEFKSHLKAISDYRDFNYNDSSRLTQANFKTLENELPHYIEIDKIINVTLRGKNDERLSAGNIGKTYKLIGIGISGDKRLRQHDGFTISMIDAISKRWKVSVYNDGDSALNCETTVTPTETPKLPLPPTFGIDSN